MFLSTGGLKDLVYNISHDMCVLTVAYGEVSVSYHVLPEHILHIKLEIIIF